MALPPGTKVGSYDILGALGAGGMGEVYRARDTRLGRDVALKILPELFAPDPDRRARFEREARVLAALNHANIAHVYDAGISETGAYLVMELVDGEDLSMRITRGPITLADALPIARQIADALEAAHDQGIVHRDLKPANIKIRPDGTVKVLDFGLAKALSPGGDDSGLASDSANSPTLTARATQLGLILGTAAYMAPEQARGKPVDRRADIWAFGVVLYEMLTGRRAFDGEDVSVTLANVIKEEAKWDALPSGVPPALRRLLRRCLEKDPRRRLSAIADARLELDDAHAAGDERTESGGGDRRRQNAWRTMVVPAMAGAALMAAAAYAFRPAESLVERQQIQFNVLTPAGAAYQAAPKLSPDGRVLAYVAPAGTGLRPAIWIRALNGVEPRVLAGTNDAESLFWSPDSEVIGYEVGSTLHKVSVSGGLPQKLAEVPNAAGGTWMKSGDVLVASNDGFTAKLWRVPGQGGVPVELPPLKGEGAAVSYGWPAMLPDDRHFVYMGWNFTQANRGIFVGDLEGSPPVSLVSADSLAAVAPGHLFFMRAGTLFAQAFDEYRLTLSGEPIRIADGIQFDMLGGYASYSVSATGLLAYRTGANDGADPSELVWLDRQGRQLGTVGSPASFDQIRLSPDGKRVAVSAATAGTGSVRVSVLDLANGVMTPLTDEKLLAADPVWSPDSQTIAFVAIGSRNQLFTQPVGGGAATPAFESDHLFKWLNDWTPDRQLLFHLPKPGKLYAVTPQKPDSLRLLLEVPGDVDEAHVSPDGTAIAYQVREDSPDSTTPPQVWLAAFPAMDHRRQISPSGGGIPLWRGDGREIFYLRPDGKLMSVGLTRSADGGFDVAPPVELFQSPIRVPRLFVDQYAVTRDGARFLFIKPQRERELVQSPITVTVNWQAGLERRPR